jgi:hypothetical protein
VKWFCKYKVKDLMSNAYSTKPIQANDYMIIWTSSINYIYFRTQIKINPKLTINIKVSNFNIYELSMEVDIIKPNSPQCVTEVNYDSLNNF